jgi:predicted transcriptional regulator
VKAMRSIVLSTLWLLVMSCSHTLTVKHQVEPIFITVQVNIKVQEELNDFFDFEEEIEGTDSEGGTQ